VPPIDPSLAEKRLTRTLLGAGAVLLVIFLLPWVVKGSRVLFTWSLIRGGSVGRVIFLVWIAVAGVNLLALSLLPPRPLRSALAVVLGLVPLVALCTTPITFGQPPAAVPDTLGYLLLAAMPVLAFGLHHRAVARESRAARAVVALGVVLVLAAFLVPRETAEGTSLPIVFLFEHARDNVGWAGTTVYLVLPIPFALVALAAVSPSPRWDRPARLLHWYFLRFVPGMFLLLAFPAFFAERGGVYRPYVLFVGAAITAYFGCVIAGTSALLLRPPKAEKP
jgi:hypothetical protein